MRGGWCSVAATVLAAGARLGQCEWVPDPMRYKRQRLHRYRVTISPYPGDEQPEFARTIITSLGVPKAAAWAAMLLSSRDPERSHL